MEAEMVSFFSQLPVDITPDILSRLPVGSVIRFKLVCKAWLSLVEDPVFLDIHTHLLLSKQPDAVTTNTEFYLRVWRLQEIDEQKHHFGEINNHETSNGSSSSSSCCFKLSKPLNDDPISKHTKRYPIGSSNGLICSRGIIEGTIYVYNPCTRECIRLPPPILIPKQFIPPIVSGFGYNPLTNEYKVVLIHCIWDEEDQKQAKVCVYTLGSGKWRTEYKLESWSLNVSFNRTVVFFNGALHWIAWEFINFDRFDIFSFDLANEEFRIIVPSPPFSARFDNSFCVELGLWGGSCLCLRQWNLVTKTTDIWMLMINSKDNKDIKSWTMKFKIPAATLTMDEKKIFRYHPVALLGRDKILLYTYEVNESVVFVSYDSETGNFDDEVIDNSELQSSNSKWSHCSIIPYTKSFLSLKAFREEEDAGLCF